MAEVRALVDLTLWRDHVGLVPRRHGANGFAGDHDLDAAILRTSCGRVIREQRAALAETTGDDGTWRYSSADQHIAHRCGTRRRIESE
jgi:hypothetical protein